MRRLLLLALVPAVAVAAPAHKPVVALLPPRAGSPEATRLGLLMVARAGGLLRPTNRYAALDLKQVLAMAGQEGLAAEQLSDDAVADQALGLLGADRVVAVSLAADGPGFALAGSVRDGKRPVAFAAKLPASWADALDQGSEAIARAVLAVDQAALPAGAQAQPQSRSDAALKALGACWETAMRQPMGIEAPVGLAPEVLHAALAACQDALKADGALRYASATLALLQAIDRDDAEAEQNLGRPADTDPALVPWVLARFWLLTRHQSDEAGVAFLAAVIKRHPGELVLRSYSAATLASMNQHARAVAAWNEYLGLSPASAFAQGRLSRSLARLGKLEPALAAAKKGLELAPASREARVALAARQLDAAKLDDAMATLKPIAALKDGAPEPLLHLGQAYWLAGDARAAAPLLQQAAERAVGPKAWRTKGRALYFTALVEAKQGRLDAAKAAYGQSLETGFVEPRPDPLLAEVVKAFARKDGGVGALAPGTLYVNLEPVLDRDSKLTPALVQLADGALRDKLGSLGASFAPAAEEKKAALALIKSRSLKGYQLRVQLAAGEAGKGLAVDMLVMTYPERSLKGSWTVKGAGGKSQEGLVKAMVARVVEDAASDLDWK